MPRLVGVDIPNNKQLYFALTSIQGIGRHTSRLLLKELNIPETKLAKDLTEDEVSNLATIIERDFLVEGALRRQVAANIGRLKDISCYRGLRHRRGLPCRGQRTRNNSRTRKGPARAVAGKKKVTT